ncbi:MAG: ankyrin repeat domain-containing protein [Pseudomonadota bacterium]|nr:ankyrin repeat domain-containing protein [Pseudomonadota bacterium]
MKAQDIFSLINRDWKVSKKIKLIQEIPPNQLSSIRDVAPDERVRFCSAFMWAIYKSQFEVAIALHQRGADSTSPCYLLQKTKLTAHGLTVVDKKSAKKDHREVSVLEMIVARNGVVLLRHLFEKKLIADINQCVNHLEQRMVHIAAKYGHCEIMRLLAEHGANINQCDGRDSRPIMMAGESGQIKMVETLIALNVEINFTFANLHFLPWLRAKCKNPHLPTQQTITLEFVPNTFENKEACYVRLIKVATPSDQAILHQIIILLEERAFSNALKLLSEFRGDCNILCQNGQSLLHLVAEYGVNNEEAYEFAKELLKRKPNIEIRSLSTTHDQYFTPLHIACEYGNIKIVILLLLHLANIDVKSANGQTPLHLAALGGHTRIVQMLCERYKRLSLNLDPCTSEGSTPLHFAIRERHVETVKLLLDLGANPTAKTIAGNTYITSINKNYGMFVPRILEDLISASPPQPLAPAEPTEVVMLEAITVPPTPTVFVPQELTIDTSADNAFALRLDEEYLLGLQKSVDHIRAFRESNLEQIHKFKKFSVAFYDLNVPIFFAIKENCVPAVEILMKHKQLISAELRYRNQPIIFKMAMSLERSDVLKAIISSLAQQQGETHYVIPQEFLSEAILQHATSIVKVLYESGYVDITEEKNSFDFIIFLLLFANKETLQLFIQWGYDFNDNQNQNPYGSLGLLIANQHYSRTRCLLEAKCVDVNKPMKSSSTALMQACKLEDERLSVKFINLLLTHGADSTITQQNGLNALHIAIILGNQAAAKALVLAKPSLISTDVITLSTGKTTSLAHLCVAFNFSWLIQHHKLCTAYAFLQQDSNGISPLQLAAKVNSEMQKIMEKVTARSETIPQKLNTETVSNDICTSRRYLIEVLGFSPAEIKSMQYTMKAKESSILLGRDGPLQYATPTTYLSGRLTTPKNCSVLRNITIKTLLVVDWDAVGKISAEEKQSFLDVMKKPKLVNKGSGVKYIGDNTMHIRLSPDDPYQEYKCCYEIKISSKARLLCIRVKSDNPAGPDLFIACHYLPRGLHTNRDTQRLEEKIQKTLCITQANSDSENKLNKLFP